MSSRYRPRTPGTLGMGGTCCPNDSGAVRCIVCRRQQRWHRTTCPTPPDDPWHEPEPNRFMCHDCWLARPHPTRPAIPTHVRAAVIARDGMTCQLCHQPVVIATRHRPDRLHLDHIERYRDNGPDTVENLRVTCANCNLGRR